MSVNSTSLSSFSLDSLLFDCNDTTISTRLNTAFLMTRVCLLLPLSIFILYLGHRQWRQQSSSKTMSHSDMFTYHNAVLELICNIGTAIYISGDFTANPYIMITWTWISSLVMSGEVSFHLLTCMERYLAVVHPITYLGLRNSRGIRIRNISIGCAWLLSFVWSTVATLNSFQVSHFPTMPILCILVFSIVIVSFCSVSVLCVLIRPGPGDVGGDRVRVDKLKYRAFFTIMAITGLLSLWFAGFLVCFALGISLPPCDSVNLVVITSGYWFMIPSSLMLPLLYLNRTGKLSCC